MLSSEPVSPLTAGKPFLHVPTSLDPPTPCSSPTSTQLQCFSSTLCSPDRQKTGTALTTAMSSTDPAPNYSDISAYLNDVVAGREQEPEPDRLARWIRSASRDNELPKGYELEVRPTLNRYLKSSPKNIAQRFRDPRTRQDPYVPFETIGDLYLAALGIKNPLIKRQIARGELTIKDAVGRQHPSEQTARTRILALKPSTDLDIVLADKEIQKFILTNLLTVSEASEIDLNISNLENLRHPLLRRYIRLGYISVADCVKLNEEQIDMLAEDASYNPDPSKALAELADAISNPGSSGITHSTSDSDSDSGSDSGSAKQPEPDNSPTTPPPGTVFSMRSIFGKRPCSI
jgi:hypothetical protein